MGTWPQTKFWDGTQWRPNFTAINILADQPASGKVATTIKLTGMVGGPSGTTQSPVATLKAGATGLNAKNCILEYSTGGAYSTIQTVATNASGIATFSTFGLSTSGNYRVRFAGDASYVASYSAIQALVMTVLKTYTKRYYLSWCNNYRANDNPSTSQSFLVQSVSVGTAARKTLIGFSSNIQTQLTGYVNCYKIQCGFTTASHGTSTADAITLAVGYHDYTSSPGTWNTARVDEDQAEVTVGHDGPVTLVLVDTPGGGANSVMTDFASGANTGLCTGPPNGSNVKEWEWVGYNDLGPDAWLPWIEFTYDKYVAS